MAQKMRVAIWEGDSEVRNRMCTIVRRLDSYDVIEYRSGAGNVEELCSLRPEVVLIDIDYTVTNPDNVVNSIRKKLPRVVLVAMSNQWDEGKRKIFGDMFDGTLLRSFDADSFIKTVQGAVINKSSDNNCTVISFFAPKGKSGRTTTIVNLAMALARVSGGNVGIIDAETNFADMDTFLNLNPQSTVVEALRDIGYLTPGTLSRYFEEVNEQVKVLCGAKTPQMAAYLEPKSLTKLIQMARNNFSYILIDLPPGFTQISIAACEASDKVYLTAMSGGAYEIEHLQRSMDIFHSLDNWEQRVECILTRMKPDARTRGEIEEKLGCPVIQLPNEYLLCAAAANNGRMAQDIGPDSGLTQQINLMADAICSNKG